MRCKYNVRFNKWHHSIVLLLLKKPLKVSNNKSLYCLYCQCSTSLHADIVDVQCDGLTQLLTTQVSKTVVL